MSFLPMHARSLDGLEMMLTNVIARAGRSAPVPAYQGPLIVRSKSPLPSPRRLDELEVMLTYLPAPVIAPAPALAAQAPPVDESKSTLPSPPLSLAPRCLHIVQILLSS